MIKLKSVERQVRGCFEFFAFPPRCVEMGKQPYTKNKPTVIISRDAWNEARNVLWKDLMKEVEFGNTIQDWVMNSD